MPKKIINPLTMSKQDRELTFQLLQKYPATSFSPNTSFQLTYEEQPYKIRFTHTLLNVPDKRGYAVFVPENQMDTKGFSGNVAFIQGYIKQKNLECCYKALPSTKKRIVKIMDMGLAGIDDIIATREVNFLPPEFKARGVYTHGDELYIIMKYFKGKAIDALKLTECEQLEITVQILNSLGELALTGKVHRDYKIENFLVHLRSKLIKTKLIDYGFAICDRETEYNYSGTYYYLAPEILERGEYNPSTDLFAAAILIAAVWKSYKRFELYDELEDNLEEYKKRCKETNFSGLNCINQQLKIGLKTLLKRMTYIDPKKRPTIFEVQQEMARIIHTAKLDYRLTPFNLLNKNSDQIKLDKLYTRCYDAINCFATHYRFSPSPQRISQLKKLLEKQRNSVKELTQFNREIRREMQMNIEPTRLDRNEKNKLIIEKLQRYLPNANRMFTPLPHIPLVKWLIKELSSEEVNFNRTVRSFLNDVSPLVERSQLVEFKHILFLHHTAEKLDIIPESTSCLNII